MCYVNAISVRKNVMNRRYIFPVDPSFYSFGMLMLLYYCKQNCE